MVSVNSRNKIMENIALDKVLGKLRGRFATVRTSNSKSSNVFCGKLLKISPSFITFYDRQKKDQRRVHRTSIREISSGSNRYSKIS